MTDVAIPQVATRPRVEWQTVALIGAHWLSFAAVTFYWRELGWWIVAPIGIYLVCLSGSLQHEALHGHPTRSRLLNELLVFPPISLWFPYRRFAKLHLQHHDDDHLTDPAADPESRYMDPQAWDSTPRWLKPLYVFNNTMLGRFIIGPALSSLLYVADELRAMRRGDRDVIEAWALHLTGCALVWWWVSVVCGMPFWQYALFIAYWGNSLTMMRSYAEHRAHDAVSCRTIVVESNPLVGLLFLNNNLHAAHHDRPALPWYALPDYYRANRTRLIEGNCGYVMKGYSEIARRWGLRAKEPVAHPLPDSLKRNRSDSF